MQLQLPANVLTNTAVNEQLMQPCRCLQLLNNLTLHRHLRRLHQLLMHQIDSHLLLQDLP